MDIKSGTRKILFGIKLSKEEDDWPWWVKRSYVRVVLGLYYFAFFHMMYVQWATELNSVLLSWIPVTVVHSSVASIYQSFMPPAENADARFCSPPNASIRFQYGFNVFASILMISEISIKLEPSVGKWTLILMIVVLFIMVPGRLLKLEKERLAIFTAGKK